MKIVGVIAEYNPLHYGHFYQLSEIRRQSQCDILVVAMSGNIVQRGEFAIVDKWQRTKMALAAGADVVVELPAIASLQSADYFAEIGILLLAHLQCEAFYFGTEQATVQELEQLLAQIDMHKEQMEVLIKQFVRQQGISYAKAHEKAIQQLLGTLSIDIALPNQQLGLQYMRANRLLSSPMSANAIVRLPQCDNRMMSATAVRQLLKEEMLQSQHVPDRTYSLLKQSALVDMEDYWTLLKYRLTLHTPITLKDILGIKEGFEIKILKEADQAESWKDLCQRLTSKRWTRSAVNRVLLAILGDIKRAEITEAWQLFKSEPSARLLGYKAHASSYLKMMRHQPLRLITNWRQSDMPYYHLQWRMDQVFCLNTRQVLSEQNLTKFPIRVN